VKLLEEKCGGYEDNIMLTGKNIKQPIVFLIAILSFKVNHYIKSYPFV